MIQSIAFALGNVIVEFLMFVGGISEMVVQSFREAKEKPHYFHLHMASPGSIQPCPGQGRCTVLSLLTSSFQNLAGTEVGSL